MQLHARQNWQRQNSKKQGTRETGKDKTKRPNVIELSLVIPCKVVTIKPNDQPWSNSYTRLLIRKKNRNYLIYKKINSDYNQLLNQNNISPECLTRHKNKKDNLQLKINI